MKSVWCQCVIKLIVVMRDHKTTVVLKVSEKMFLFVRGDNEGQNMYKS